MPANPRSLKLAALVLSLAFAHYALADVTKPLTPLTDKQQAVLGNKASGEKRNRTDVPVGDWAKRLEYIGPAVNEPGFHIWGCSPVIGDDGRVHMIVARWPVDPQGNRRSFSPGWRHYSTLAHYVADSPEGPFTYVKTIAPGIRDDNTGKTWGVAPHSPNLQKVGDQYVTTYVANTGVKGWPGGQRIGMLIADDINGPWRKVGDENGIILHPPEDPEIWSHKAVLGMTNPALVAAPDGRFLLYYKAKASWKKTDPRKMGIAIADRIEGPYIHHKDPVTSNDRTVEDGYAFIENGKIYLLTTDNDRGSGLLWSSQDGINFNDPPELGFGTLESYWGKDLVMKSPNYYYPKFEVPQLLIIDGHPAYLYVASGVNITGMDGTCSYVFRIRKAGEPQTE